VNRLRVFIKPEADGSKSADIFYSQRGPGPIYCWHYEKDSGQWRVARMQNSAIRTHELCATSWKSVPQKLQAQLSDHYLE
jgi:hypothetical protein